MLHRRLTSLAMLAVVAFSLAACTASPTKQLERVARDWSLTVRASQVIPVYPIREDVQPGDIFLVPVTISKQAELYEGKGFLPLDMIFTRLTDMPYTDFYKDAYWSSTYSSVPHKLSDSMAPRAAFPSYTFSVDRSGGLQLALPIQAVPFGLGLMGAARATGTVTISDSFTYGVDGERAYDALLDWHQKFPENPKYFCGHG